MSTVRAGLRPAPGAAPMPSMVRAQAGMETRLLLRNGEQVLLALVIPIPLLIGGAESGDVLDLGSGPPDRRPHAGRPSRWR